MIKLTIRQSNGEQFDVQVEATGTVADLKAACVAGCKLEADAQRLIFKGKSVLFNVMKGRILKDEETL